MKVNQAISRAREYLSETFAGEDVSDVRLEEVVYERADEAWLITFGLMRPSIGERLAIPSVFAAVPLKRTYKVVRVPEDEDDIPSIRIRDLVED